MSAAERAKKYMFAIALTYMCYLTHGIQAIILSQNQVNFYTQWGYTDATAGAAAVSMAILFCTALYIQRAPVNLIDRCTLFNIILHS